MLKRAFKTLASPEAVRDGSARRFKRAGADGSLTYFALDAAVMLKEKR